MGILDAVFSLLLLLACTTAAATPLAPPSPNCPNKCGNMSFGFPFGVGPDCFRQADFGLVCDHTTRPPRLLLVDGFTEVRTDIYPSSGWVYVTVPLNISTRPGVDVYNKTWKAPSASFGVSLTGIYITDCGFDVMLLGSPTVNPGTPLCQVTCTASGKQMDIAPSDCSYSDYTSSANSLRLQFVRRKAENANGSPTEKTIIHVAVNVTIDWSIIDQPTCMVAKVDKRNYACASNNSVCQSSMYASHPGYWCSCDIGYMGNPYVPGGCSRDYGYNPVRQNANCPQPQRCGNIDVPFPFGLDEGCSARKELKLRCIDAAASKLVVDQMRGVSVRQINVQDGFMETEHTLQDNKQYYGISLYTEDTSQDKRGSVQSSRVQWVVSNLTCLEAINNLPSYACVSNNSICYEFNSSTSNVAGYRCKCMPGFKGNPYVQSGCEDIDECKTQPGICEGRICHNTKGNYTCESCPSKKEYDITKMKCVPTKRQNILLGISIGLGAGFVVLVLILSVIFIIRGWRRDIQKQLQRKYFRKNQGLLLEQLILSNENASDNTKIFSLEELEKATNNFDHMRIVGRGGHGMVYKGILSDQRVVAIKKSKVIKQGEIEQFINEVVILSQINHRNIVKLYGCCLETEVPLLVYDFVPNGSLFEILHSGSSSSFSLTWDDCLRITAETAGALYYLHSAASISVFHRDVKSSNILLDANYTAKVSDFGASRLVPTDQTHVSTIVQGTFGYLDPEYYHTGQLNEKSDVYSFGVLLLEMLLRKKPVFTSESGSAQNLSSYFLGELKEKPIKELVDAQIQEDATDEEIDNVASLAEMCLRIRSEERPTMKEVEIALQFLRTRRLDPHNVSLENGKDMQSLLRTRAKGIVESHSGYQCSTLEQEFSSVFLPR